MEFRDIQKQYLHNKERIDSSIQNVLNTGIFIGGSPVKKIEDELKEFVDRKFCITCANGTDALSIALKAMNIQKGDAVFVPDFTFFASGEVVSGINATPIFVDVDERTFNLDCDKLLEAILKIKNEGKLVPKLIIAVDLFGLPADYVKIEKIAEEFNMLVLEDAAQGFGGSIGNRKTCSFGDIAITSFFPAKPLGCYGDGGAIFTDNAEYARFINSYKAQGKGDHKYDNIRIGVNSRLDSIQAAILSVKLDIFEWEFIRVNEVNNKYSSELSRYVVTPLVLNEFKSSFAQYTIQLSSEQERNQLKNYLKSKKIPTMVYYPKTMQDQIAFDPLYTRNLNSTSERLTKNCLSLPIHPYMEHSEIELVIQEIVNFKIKIGTFK